AHIPPVQYFKVVLIFNIITELNVLLDNLSERYFPIPSRIITRVLLHFLLSLTIGLFALIYFERQIKYLEVLQEPITWLLFAFGLFFVFIMVVISISLRIVSKWIGAQREVEALRQLQMKNDYNALQDQLNPHFLFNNLSVLKSMIRYDPEAAVAFTQNFTDTFRYVLQTRDRTTVSLGEELEFIRSYLELHQERLGEGLRVEINVDPELKTRRIPPLSLQLLVENAIKHNVVSTERPLYLKILATGESIRVENNIQIRESSYSTEKGLANLVARYEFLTERKVTVDNTGIVFSVELPLL
ncbi:MAG: histidine kinase, partial [Prolixibacteraceae bacterium]|nr:histidine kinase [Prolixibacteraceae bacterium]